MILVPAGSEFLFQPRRSSALGAPPSTRQTLPSGVLMWIHECGIDPLELDHLALQLDRLVAVELGRERVVGESGAAAGQARGGGEDHGTP